MSKELLDGFLKTLIKQGYGPGKRALIEAIDQKPSSDSHYLKATQFGAFIKEPSLGESFILFVANERGKIVRFKTEPVTALVFGEPTAITVFETPLGKYRLTELSDFPL